MALKRIANLFRRKSRANAVYWAFTPQADIPAGSRVMIFRREEQPDGAAGSVCIATDDDPPRKPTERTAPKPPPAGKLAKAEPLCATDDELAADGSPF